MGDALRAAITAGSDALHNEMYGDNGTWQTRNECDIWMLRVLQALPAVVLARLAIERGGLAPCGQTLMFDSADGGPREVVPVYCLTDAPAAAVGEQTPSPGADDA